MTRFPELGRPKPSPSLVSPKRCKLVANDVVGYKFAPLSTSVIGVTDMNPIIEKLPPWYHGDRLREYLALEIPSSELSCHVLDEIIDEILNNP